MVELSEHEVDLMDHPSCSGVNSLIDVPRLRGEPISKCIEADVSSDVTSKLVADF